MRKQTLKSRDVIALGFMTLALFLGAGNIIYPPYVGKITGGYYVISALGFIISGVILPMLAVMALASKNGDPLEVCAPLGKFWGKVLASSFYLFLGVFFASPRTATVSYEMGLRNFLPDHAIYLYGYTAFFFACVWLLALYPHRLLKSIGYILAPVKILCLTLLAVYAMHSQVAPVSVYSTAMSVSAFSSGVINGYLTMDTLSALTFGVLVINIMKGKGISGKESIRHYTLHAVLIAGMGLAVLYVCLMKIGAGYGQTAGFENGAEILRAFIVEHMGVAGMIFMAVLVWIACTVTAVGLTSSTAMLFSQMSGIRYNVLLPVVIAVSLLIANFGLTRLIAFSVPALSVICPACTTLIVLTLLRWPSDAIALPVWVSIVFSFYDAVLKPQGLSISLFNHLPLSDASLGWLLPSVLTALVLRVKNKTFSINTTISE
ncbi:TPA: branched-chain amino acid transport system II carrier protein [Enterobacter ludwigii]